MGTISRSGISGGWPKIDVILISLCLSISILVVCVSKLYVFDAGNIMYFFSCFFHAKKNDNIINNINSIRSLVEYLNKSI